MLKKFFMMLFLTVYVQAESLPLEGREFGVEFNIPRLLTYSESWKSVSGTFSYFNHEDKVEIALPWSMAFFADREGLADVEHFDVSNLDIHYRKFLGEEMNGFYLSGFARASYLNGLLENEDKYDKTMKLGVGVGLGYRVFPSTKRHYWGVGLIVGRYITGENELYREVGLGIEDMPIIVDIEFLKFGYAF